MAFLGRHSKFKHVKGDPFKKDRCYEGVKISKNPFESNRSDVNGKFLAVILESQGGGAFMVIPLSQTGRIDINAPKVSGHGGTILALAFNPFNDNVIASCSEDCSVKIWEIPDEGLTVDIKEPVMALTGHTHKVGTIAWHPTAENVIASGGFDNTIIVWNVETGEEMINLPDWHTGGILSMSWNYDGSMLATSCKDKAMRVIDPRKGTLISEAVCYNGAKSSQIIFCGSLNYVFTTGFSRNNDRQYGVFDPRDLSKPLALENLDKNSGVNLIYFDEGTKMIYLAGKGDSTINYFEIITESPYVVPLTFYQSKAPQVGMCSMPKRHLNHSDCEVMRLYKLHNSSPLVEPIAMTVPRKSNLFQTDIFPPCFAGIPVMSADEWMSGSNKPPALVEITKDGVGGQVAGKAMRSSSSTTSAPATVTLSKQSSHSSTGSSGARERTPEREPSPPLVIESSQVRNDEENRTLRARVQELLGENERLKRELAAKESILRKIKDLV